MIEKSKAKTNFYYVIPFLPELPELPAVETEIANIREPAPEAYDGVIQSIFEELDEKDAEMARYLLFPTDNLNLADMIWQNERKNQPGWGGPFTEPEFREGGLFDRETLYSEIQIRDEIPRYMKLFLEERSQSEIIFERASYLPVDHLSNLFYAEVTAQNNDFLRQWFAFERDLRNMVAATRARKHEMPVQRRRYPRIGEAHAQAMIGNSDVVQAIFSSGATDYGLAGVYDWVAALLEFDDAPLSRAELGIDRIRWEMAEQICRQTADDPWFSLERVLTFMIQYRILNRWQKLHQKEEKLEGIVDQLKNQFIENLGVL